MGHVTSLSHEEPEVTPLLTEPVTVTSGGRPHSFEHRQMAERIEFAGKPTLLDVDDREAERGDPDVWSNHTPWSMRSESLTATVNRLKEREKEYQEKAYDEAWTAIKPVSVAVFVDARARLRP
eukprot:3121455-Rhodomonas_salina.1